MPSLRGIAAAALASCVAVAGLVATPAEAAAPPPATTPDKDPFYTPPSPLPEGKPGDVIRSRPSVYTVDPFGKTPVAGVKSWQVLYRSESVGGKPIAVSGTVLVPQTPWKGTGKRPVVSWGVGTRGLGDACAPSQTLSKGLDYEGFFILDALNKGFAVAVTDMEGLGTPGQHTYEVGGSQGRSVLNMARAATRLGEAGLPVGSPVGLMGYSQGGTSTGHAAELAHTYAPELDIKGVVAGGVPADLIKVAEGLDGGPFVALAFMAGVGYDAAYPELDLAKYLNDKGRALLAKAKDHCLVSFDTFPLLIDTAFRKFTDYTTTNPMTTPEWKAKLNANRLGSTAPKMPVFQPQAYADQVIPFGQAQTLAKEWCAKGANVTWKPVFGEHALGMVVGWPDSITFMTDRFAGKPVKASCPS